jgi:hypothetical protein
VDEKVLELHEDLELHKLHKPAENPAMYAIVGRISVTASGLPYSIVSGNHAITVL